MECYECQNIILKVGYGHFVQRDQYIENEHIGCYLCENCVEAARKVTKLALGEWGIDKEPNSWFPMTCPLSGCHKIVLIESGVVQDGFHDRVVFPISIWQERQNIVFKETSFTTIESKKIKFFSYVTQDRVMKCGLTYESER
jgi:hypothetical protein